METKKMLVIDGKETEFTTERNLLEVVRAAKIELPTFCYHSELSVYGACRLCMVHVEGRGMVPACSTPPEAGMRVLTNTEEIREMRRIVVELLLANHEQACPTCGKSAACQLQNLARRLGITEVRFKKKHTPLPIDRSTYSLERDPNKCVLCGDCVRICSEIQSVGAIDFAHRGTQSMVLPRFGKNLDKVECVYCGQCARVCPTGALVVKSEVDKVWKAIDDPNVIVVAQIAPAVRVGLGERFGLEPGVRSTGRIVAALRAMGFDRVYDTSYAADLTVLEEGTEFLNRVKENKKLPQFTSCCPAWVKFVEHYYPEMLPNVSSCRSPQQMFGAVAKEVMAKEPGMTRSKVVVVSIMPCTAKKYEAKREEFATHGVPDVDHVITTQELARMIEQMGLQFNDLQPASFDLPFGFKTGAGIIFGNSGGVSEAVLRYLSEAVTGKKGGDFQFLAARGEDGVRTLSYPAGDRTLTVAIVHGLANARRVIDEVKAGKAKYDFIEVMACPGGCIGGAGQPEYRDPAVRAKRAKGLYDNDTLLQVHRSQENPYLTELYRETLGEPGGKKAHGLLHTNYHRRRRISKGVSFTKPGEKKIEVDVCFGKGCFMKGSQKLLRALVDDVNDQPLAQGVEVKASFCFEKCNHGPVVKIGETILEDATVESARAALERELKGPHTPEVKDGKK